MLIKSEFEGYSKDGIRLYFCDGGGGGSGSADQTVTQKLAPYAEPFAKEVLGKGQALSNVNYQTYGGERQAQFTPLMQKAYTDAGNLGPSAAGFQGIDMARTTGERALNAPVYETGQFQNQFSGPSQFRGGEFQNQFSGPSQFQAGNFDARNVDAPQLNQYGLSPAQQITQDSFTGAGTAQNFMSPYMQNVVDIQQREAQRTADIAGTQRGASAVKSGAFGGSRQAIMDAEAARNLATQKGDIQATGQQSAFQNAQQQYNAEMQRNLAAQQANQGAGLTVGQQNLNAALGIQQLGAGQSMQSQLANQQVSMELQRLREQSRQFGAGQDMNTAQQLAQFGQSAQQLREQSRQFGAGQDMNTAQNLAQFGQSAQQLRENSRQFAEGQRQQGLQTALQSAGQLGALGSQQFAQGFDANLRQQQFGTQQQQQVQSILDRKEQDFRDQQRAPYQQVEFLSGLLRGTPTGSVQELYRAPPTLGSQLLGAGTALTGAYLTGGGGKAKGGAVTSGKARKAGLNELALTKMRG